ncbi:MAG: hypothetical protein EXQ52_02860 [Bryobacterales bacterium]|nr:hypothetical protein [Bryobacterales bacterium]
MLRCRERIRGADYSSGPTHLAVIEPVCFDNARGGPATDNEDPSPARLTPQIGGVDVLDARLFPLGTTAVTFRFQDVSGIIGSAPASVTVILGRPAISCTVIAKGPYTPGVLWLDLRLTNTGSGHGRNFRIDQIVPRTLSGSGQVTLAAPPPWPIRDPEYRCFYRCAAVSGSPVNGNPLFAYGDRVDPESGRCQLQLQPGGGGDPVVNFARRGWATLPSRWPSLTGIKVR